MLSICEVGTCAYLHQNLFQSLRNSGLAAKHDKNKVDGAAEAATDSNHKCSKFLDLENLRFDFQDRARSLKLIRVPEIWSTNLLKSTPGKRCDP